MSKLTPEAAANIQKLKEEQNRLRQMTEAIPGELEQILFQEGWRIMNKSLKIAPIEFGLLRASARVDIPERDGNRVSVGLSYNTDYAVYVEQKNDGGQPVPYKAPGTHSLFLKGPIEESLEEMEQRISERMKRMVMVHAGR